MLTIAPRTSSSRSSARSPPLPPQRRPVDGAHKRSQQYPKRQSSTAALAAEASRQARLIRIQQTSGVGVSMALRPSRGLRDDILFAGGKPKNHQKENYQRIKELEKQNKQAEEEKSKPSSPPFKLKKFEGVPSRLSTRRSESSEVSPASSSPSGSRPTSSLGSSAVGSTISSQKNFIQLNAQRAKQPTPFKRPESVASETSSRRSTPVGAVPKYLIERKLEWAEKEERKLEQLRKSRIPPGMRVLGEEERLDSLNFLMQRRSELLTDLSNFGLIVESLSAKKRRAALEESLQEIEEAIDIFSRKGVCVKCEGFEEAEVDRVHYGEELEAKEVFNDRNERLPERHEAEVLSMMKRMAVRD
ncbi:calmodulin-binding-domain-containing protein [Zopfochytrium polystomum]|nr:calmodulin-binding-domain-containing protein [Zopfochytrium polystomum]